MDATTQEAVDKPLRPPSLGTGSLAVYSMYAVSTGHMGWPTIYAHSLGSAKTE